MMEKSTTCLYMKLYLCTTGDSDEEYDISGQDMYDLGSFNPMLNSSMRWKNSTDASHLLNLLGFSSSMKRSDSSSDQDEDDSNESDGEFEPAVDSDVESETGK